MDPKHKVETGYDRIAERYLAAKNLDDPVIIAALEDLTRGLPPGGAALDLGCGAGLPVTRWLARRFHVIGVDLSLRQLKLARARVPDAALVKADMAELHFQPRSFDAVAAFYSIIHVPRARQPELLRRVHTWLKPGGALLAPWAIDEWEGEEDNWEGWGAPMWWSHYGADTNLQMLRAAGFQIESAEPRTSNGETWLWILARKVDPNAGVTPHLAGVS